MGYCVFIVRPDSIYDDSPAEQYQFPKQYLGRAKDSVGDWVVYLEPTRTPNTRGYFAIANVKKIIPDSDLPDMFLAIIEPGSYLDFGRNVPFSDLNSPIERGLLNEQGRLSGRAQAAVRPISPTDFLRIIEKGLNQPDPILPRAESSNAPVGLGEDQSPYTFETERERILKLTSRTVRNSIFRQVVLRAYDERCAITGLKFINGGGRAEVNAAHIQPVSENGPDMIRNGIALSGTAHWMFDRGLISLSDDLEIMISRKINDIDSVRAFINESGCASVPLRESERPHPRFLGWHRKHCFET